MTANPNRAETLAAIDGTRRAFRGDSAAQLIGTYLAECVGDSNDEDLRLLLDSILDDLEETIALYRRETGTDTTSRS